MSGTTISFLNPFHHPAINQPSHADAIAHRPPPPTTTPSNHSMSWSINNLSPFADVKQDPLALSSPPGSAPRPSSAVIENILQLDPDSLDPLSPPRAAHFDVVESNFYPVDLPYELSHTPSSTPSSTALISPKSSISPRATQQDESAAEALSRHHLERYLHYRRLAAEAEADAPNDSMPSDNTFYKSDSNTTTTTTSNGNMMASYPPGYYNVPHVSSWNQQYPSYQPQGQAAAMHAQAQAHMQAHDAAYARVQHQRNTMNQVPYYMPAQRASFDGVSAPPTWSRHSTSTTSGQSPPYQPGQYAQPMPHIKADGSMPAFTAESLDGHHVGEGENELDDDDEHDTSIPSMGVANIHGGGRGYIPGKTPEDPKKRHKCQICGRGFARAFNLKSHVQTHNPLRSKPHQCPHPSCKRGFSRLHDLERHRQGIHSDGPLVEAKRMGVPPAVARAQSRMQRRAESGGLI